jgi:hypothetical protein
MNIVEAEQGLKMVVIICVCKQDNGSWIQAEGKAPECSAIREGVFLCPGNT